jgi:Mg2+ and Co2+ transporter CorA
LDRLNKDLQIANELWSEEYDKLYEEKQQLVAERNNVNRMMYTLSIVSIILVPIYSSVIYVTLLRR